MDITMERLNQMRDAPVFDTTGDKIGSVEELFYDEQTGQPEWIGIGTGFFGTKRVLVPVEGASVEGDGIRVPYEKDKVKDSPDIDGDEISQERERELYSYYGVSHSERRSDTVLPEGERTRGTRKGGESVTRSEEELRVGKRETEAGRARLRKWVETEPASADVDLKRETAHVTRERIDQPVGDADIGEEELDMPLRREEAVAGKETVAKERVGLEKDVDTKNETVSDELRKERVDVEGDVSRGRGRR
jgi:uncharacterized protein (TIGR02271 family)